MTVQPLPIEEQHKVAIAVARMTLDAITPRLSKKNRKQMLESANIYCEWYGRQFVWEELKSILSTKDILIEDLTTNVDNSILNESWMRR